MDTIYRVNMSDLSVRSEKVDGEMGGLGGRGLTSAVVAREVPARCHPLSEENKLVIAPGILSGTAAPCSGRLSVGAKSPLTGTIKESNAGGTAAGALANLGIKAIIIEGKPQEDKLYRLVVSSDGIKIEEAQQLKGLGNYDTVERLFDEFGKKVSCLSIGQAGEMRVGAASIAVTDPEGRPTRHCGRGGMGAVMGAKGVKAIVVDASGGKRPEVADKDAFRAATKKFAKCLARNPLTGETLPTYGTNALANVVNEAGAYPTRNFKSGKFDLTEQISGERQHDVILERGGVIAHACHRGCTIKCSRIYMDKQGEYLTKGPEYETIWAHGPNCEIGDLDAIAQMDRMDDDFGLDTIEIGATIAVAMEAGVIPFGDAKAAIGLLAEVGKGSPLGRLLASGAQTLGKAFGVERIPTVKGQSMPAYDPRAVKGIGVTYATSTMGADHTAGYAVTKNLGGEPDALKPEGQVELSRELQITTAALDSGGLCLFVAFALLDDPEAVDAMCEMFSGFWGKKITGDDLATLGKSVLSTERRFNAEAGFTAADDRLPRYFSTEKLPPHDVTFDVPDKELDSVFDFAK